MTVKALFPTSRPSLDLNFAKTKRLDPRITFSRSSTATYIGSDGLIKSAAVNEARFDHNPATGESLGLLVEEARTNEHPNSTINALSQGIVGLTQGSASIVAPTGATSTVETWAVDTSTGNHSGYYFYSNDTVAYGYSLFVKPNGTTKILVSTNTRDNDPGISVDLTTGQVFAGTSSNYLISKLTNGWVRISVITPSMRAHGPGFRLLDASGNSSFTGNGTSGVYVWGMQFERGSSSTSYIPTSGSQVTRAADVASITGTNFSSWYRQDEGTINTAFTSNGKTAANLIWRFSSGSESMVLWAGNTGTGALVVDTAGGRTVQLLAREQIANGKNAFAYKQNNFAFVQNGGAASTDTAGNTTTTINSLIVAQQTGGENPLNGTIARLAYYPVRLPDATLQALTAS